MHRIGALVAETCSFIALIVYELGELYHEAAIISYLADMETVGYREGIDEPAELRFHLSSVVESVNTIREEVLALSRTYERYSQRLDVGPVLDVTEDILILAQQINSHADLDELVLPENRLMFYVDKLRGKIQDAIEQAATSTQDIMPILFHAQSLERVTYEDIRRNPQASVQLAFTLFESHLRSRINAGAELFGEALINRAYGNNGCLSYGATPAERVGTRNLMSGAYAIFRNPRMHRVIGDDEQTAIILIALADLLMRVVDESEDK